VNHIAYTCQVVSGDGLKLPEALATNPQFILLDEPFAGVDPYR